MFAFQDLSPSAIILSPLPEFLMPLGQNLSVHVKHSTSKAGGMSPLTAQLLLVGL